MTTEQRFWAKVRKTASCWIWTASKRSKGYGAFAYTRGGRLVQSRAHRYSWEIHKGAIPDGLCVLHNCPSGDNPACVNPCHLFLGTRADNNADMISKQRHVPGGQRQGVEYKYRRGEAHPNARLSKQEISEIRKHRSEGWSFRTISREHGISIGYAFRVVNGIARKDVQR
jgi:hypothetical protein